MDSRVKKKSIHKVGHAKKSETKQNIKSSSRLMSRSVTPNAIAECNSVPCHNLSTVRSSPRYPTGDKLPPDFLGTKAYLLVADNMSLGPELLEAAGLGAIVFKNTCSQRTGWRACRSANCSSLTGG